MFLLHQPKSTRPTYILIKKQVTDGRFQTSLDIKILPAFWDFPAKRAITTNLDKTTTDENKSINNVLQKIEGFYESYRRDARFTGKPLTKAIFGKKVDEILGRKGDDNSLYPAAEAIISDMEEGKLRTSRGQKYADSSIRKYRQSLEIFKEIAPELTFEGVNMEFYRQFMGHGVKKDWSNNYAGTHIKNLKKLMEEAAERGLHENLEYKKKSFKRLREKTSAIALEIQELQLMYEFKCADDFEERGRDWFILDCFTGLRISDVQLLEDHHLSSDTITIVNKKTSAKVAIPMHPYVRAILKRWDGLPPKMSNDDISKHAKNVARLAGLSDIVVKSLTKGGRTKTEYWPKWKRISPHTARRSFITNLLEAGIADNMVMQLAGITSHDTLMLYKKTAEERAARIMQDHAFFKGEHRTPGEKRITRP